MNSEPEKYWQSDDPIDANGVRLLQKLHKTFLTHGCIQSSANDSAESPTVTIAQEAGEELLRALNEFEPDMYLDRLPNGDDVVLRIIRRACVFAKIQAQNDNEEFTTSMTIRSKGRRVRQFMRKLGLGKLVDTEKNKANLRKTAKNLTRSQEFTLIAEFLENHLQ